jgi:hypothetical protein
VGAQGSPQQPPQLRRGSGDGTETVAGCPRHEGNHPLRQHQGIDPGVTGARILAGGQIPSGQPHSWQDRQAGRHRGPRGLVRPRRIRQASRNRVPRFCVAATRGPQRAGAGQSGYRDATDRPVGLAHRQDRQRENGAVRLIRLAAGRGAPPHVMGMVPGGIDPADRFIRCRPSGSRTTSASRRPVSVASPVPSAGPVPGVADTITRSGPASSDRKTGALRKGDPG